jgi:hypothetical protein
MNGTTEPDDDEPWPVAGVTADAREAAATAAAAEGRAVGAWIEAAIRDAVAMDHVVTGGRQDGVSTADIVAAIEALGSRIAAAEHATRQAVAPLQDRLDRLSLELAEIEERPMPDRNGPDETADDTETGPATG